MTQRQHLLNIRFELDELVHAVLAIDDLVERDLIVARCERAKSAISAAILELDSVELSGFDC